MRILIDTHILLWWLANDQRLSSRHKTLIADPANQVLVSSISVAEISIKASLGKLEAPTDGILAIKESGLDLLPFSAAAAEALRDLPWHHRDPFDRMLVAQALADNLLLLSADPKVELYGHSTIGG